MDKFLKKVNSWRKLAYCNDDYFIKFIAEYIAFNAMLRKKYGYKCSDGDLIKCLKEDVPPGFFLSGKISKKFKKLTELMPIINVRGVEANWNNTEITKEQLENDDRETINALYAIRNNLFHGDKRHSTEDEVYKRDEQLVKVGYELLRFLNDWLIKNLKKRECDNC